MAIKILQGNCINKLKTIADKTFHTCVTSPPYWGLRDYGEDDQLGLEETPQEYVVNMVEVFREVRRVLQDDGTVWLNLGDSYASIINDSIKPKDLVGIPWRVAFALQEDGWYLRQDIIWHKPNPMPESVKDRCTKSHEYIFLFSKSKNYYFDNESIKEKGTQKKSGNVKPQKGVDQRFSETKQGLFEAQQKIYEKVNKRSVWTVTTKPYKEAHFATYPPDLIEPCILAGCPEGGHVLDPFGGSGTTALVADRLGRNATLIELNKSYVDIINNRLKADNSLFMEIMNDN